MNEELRTTRPIGVLKYSKAIGHEDPSAEKAEIDWDFFMYDSNRDVYIRKPAPLFDENSVPRNDPLWVYTGEMMRDWSEELKNVVFVFRDGVKEYLSL